MQERTFKQDEVDLVAQEVISRLEAMSHTEASVLALSGDLGAGKTTLAQAIARTLGITETVTSPTFVLEKVYPLAHVVWKRLIHIDAYRIDDESELAVLGFREACADPTNLLLIEWPERVPNLVPSGALRLFLMHNDEMTRTMRSV